MRGLKHNGNMTIQTQTGFKGRKLNKPAPDAIQKKNEALLKVFEDCGVELV